MIPKIIYQTWKTQNLPPQVKKIQSKMMKINPGYDHSIYTDSQMEDFISSNFDKEIKETFFRINHIVSRADFWRYLILYKNGGVYLDIDSEIVKPLDTMISEEDKGIMTAEKNKDLYVQWALAFEKGHPILEATINKIIENINSGLYKNDVHSLTVKPYSYALEKITQKYSLNINWDDIKENTNNLYEFGESNLRIFGIDYMGFINFKHKHNHTLRYRKKGVQTDPHWTITEKASDIYT